MLYEEDVIDAVCNHLQNTGHTIKQRLRPNQRGDDIIAIEASSGHEVYVEAKGETSSLSTSKGYGRAFDTAQCRDHVANALYKAAATLQKAPASVTRHVGIALPDTACHRARIGDIADILRRLRITVFWVDAQKNVTLSTPL
jgi:hypothetical protein